MTTTIRWPSTQEEHIHLAQTLIELVGGRADVVARYHEFKDGDRLVKGWGPWKGRRVSKDYKPLPGELVHAGKNYKSGELEYRVLNPLSAQNVIEHLRGKERLGVYVLDPVASCKFIAADFDDHQGELAPEAVLTEVRRFVEACEAHEWKAHIERSKSGKGYHVWLFFDAPVEAGKARAIGRWLFEESQSLREGEDFSTFDRFFPAQSKLLPTSKGFGNLIGLPLCGAREYAAGRTAWVARDGALIEDAAAYTQAIVESGRNAASRVEAFMAEWELSVDETEGTAAAPRDREQKLGTREEWEAVGSRCAFLKWAASPDNQSILKEPQWYAMVSNMARFDIDEAIHAASRGHKGYNESETDGKIEHARGFHPHKCTTIQANGFKGCPKGGCKLPTGQATKAPAGLAVWGKAREEKKKRDRTVKIVEPAKVQEAEAPPAPATEGGPWKRDTPIYPDTNLPWPTPVGGFQVTPLGVQDNTNSYIATKPIWVDACTRDIAGHWGVSIKFFDLDWKLKTHAIPRERLHEQGGVLGRELAALGLPILPGKEKWVSRYLVLQENGTQRRIRAAGRLGWFDAPDSPAVFVFPDQVLGTSPEEIVYQPDVPMTSASDTLHGQGKLADWQKYVADPCVGNPVLMFAVMVGLAGPLLKLCQEQSGGFHLYGVTTAGKTTAAQVAASVWGCAADPQEGPEVTSLRKWYTTGNALETLAEVHNDMLLVLDEISEVDPHELGRIIYQLAGGLSKGRANAGGGLRMMRAWRLLFLSTGEKSVRQMLAFAGQTQKGGQRVRLPDIPVDSDEDGSRAIVLDPHGRDPKDFVQDLKAACAKHYGLAGPVFAAYLIAQAEALGMSVLAGQLREELRQLEAMLCQGVEDKLPPEGRRVIRRFALIALAGGRAMTAQILGWDLGTIIEAVKHVRDRWLSEQGREYSEAERAIAHVRNQIMTHADRFRCIDGSVNGGKRTSGPLLGFRVREYYLVTEKGMDELCGEHDARAVLRALKNSGHLWHAKDRLTRKSPKIEEYGNTRPYLYWVKVAFLGEQVDFDTEEDMQAGPSVSPETRRRELKDGEEIPF